MVTRFSGRSSTTSTTGLWFISICPAIKSGAFIQRSVMLLFGCDVQGLVGPQAHDAESDKALVEKFMHPVLQRLTEIDQYIPAEDHVEIVKRRICSEIVLRERHPP